MKKYPRYKESGVVFYTEIPEQWQLRKIKFLLLPKRNAIKTGPFGSQLKSTDLAPDGIKVYNQRSVLDNDFDSGNNYISYKKYKTLTEFEIFPNDILLTTRGTIGKCSIFPHGKQKGVLHPCLIRLQIDNSKMLNEYLVWYIQESHFFNENVIYNSNATTIEVIYSNTLREIVIPTPSIREQKEISGFLDLKTNQIDTLIIKKQKQIDLLKEFRTAIINQAVTKGLNPNVKMKDSGNEWLGEIPEHWEVKKLKYISDIVLGKMVTPLDKGNYIQKPYLRAKNIIWEAVDTTDIKEMWFSYEELVQYKLKLNDLLVSEGGEVGRTAIWKNELNECYIQNSVNKVTIHKKYNYKYFLYHFVTYGKKYYFDAIVNRVSIAHLTKEKLQDVFFLVPPSKEQNSISEFLDNQILKIDKLVENTKRYISSLQEYRTTLISEVVTGKIDVRDFKNLESLKQSV